MLDKFKLLLTDVPAEETLTFLDKINEYMKSNPFQTALIGIGVLMAGFFVYRSFKKGRR